MGVFDSILAQVYGYSVNSAFSAGGCATVVVDSGLSVLILNSFGSNTSFSISGSSIKVTLGSSWYGTQSVTVIRVG